MAKIPKLPNRSIQDGMSKSQKFITILVLILLIWIWFNLRDTLKQRLDEIKAIKERKAQPL